MPVRNEHRPGFNLVDCATCGFTKWSDEVKRDWKGLYQCRECHDGPRHPQDFVRGVPDRQNAVINQHYTDVFIGVTDVTGDDL